MRDAKVLAHGFQQQDFERTLNQALGRSDIVCPPDVHGGYPDFCRAPYSFMTRRNDDKAGEFCSDALAIDRGLSHLVQNNMAYSTTTERLQQKMALFAQAIDQKGN